MERMQVSDILLIGDWCLYPQNPTLALGFCASIFLIMAQATVAAAGRCCGSCGKKKPSETKQIAAVVCAVFSWIAAVVAFVMLVYGAAMNANVVRHTYSMCYFLPDGVFAGAAVLTLVATALGLTSYVLLRGKPSPKTDEQQQQLATGAAGVAMAQTQLPPPPQQEAPPQGQALPYYPQYNASPHGYGQFPHPPAQGYGAHASNQQFPPQGYGAHGPNMQVIPQCYGAHEPNQQFPPSAAAQGHEPHAQVPPPDPNGHNKQV